MLIKVPESQLVVDPAGNMILDKWGNLQVDDIRETEPIIEELKSWEFKGFKCTAWKTSYPGESIPPLYAALATRGKTFSLNGRGDTEEEAKEDVEKWIKLTWKSYYKSK